MNRKALSMKELGDGNALFGNEGEEKFFLPSVYSKYMDNVKNMEIKKGDVWTVGFPRSGTNMTQEMLWLVDHDLDFKTAKKVKLSLRSLYLEHGLMWPDHLMAPLKEELNKNGFNYLDLDTVLGVPSPRHYKTHLCLPLLPDNLLDTAKVVFLVRNPKDVFVSRYNLVKWMKWTSYDRDFKTFVKDYINEREFCAPFFDHVKEALKYRNHPNCITILYEEFIKDIPATIRRVCKFLNKEYTEAQLDALHQHLKFDNMKKNDAMVPDDLSRQEYINKNAQGFIRNGKSGSWREYFDDELNELTDRWIDKNLSDTDFRFHEI